MRALSLSFFQDKTRFQANYQQLPIFLNFLYLVYMLYSNEREEKGENLLKSRVDWSNSLRHIFKCTWSIFFLTSTTKNII